jgi:photosystem II stability/assembly factor-like uncharacterized protein
MTLEACGRAGAKPARWRLFALACSAFIGSSYGAAPPPAPEPSVFAGLGARAIGTARTSGRISAIDATTDRPGLIVVGTASGGVWRSRNGGATFDPIFDQHIQSIGAVRIDPSNSKTIWVGTGESRVRNSVSIGDGVYRSIDGGEQWQHMGLPNSERIAELHISPKDPKRIWVCVSGALWSDSSERGVYRSIDGGQNWTRTLYRDARTGCSDLALDPSNPDVLYAGMWSFRRSPDFFESGGKGSGLFRSSDGGATWSELKNGLPLGEKGRIAVAVAPSDPKIVYALVEARPTALYRSADGGDTWEQRNSGANIAIRPFYFGELTVDPMDPERVYRPGLFTTVSIDGGKTFGMLNQGLHPDHHVLWIHPHAPNELLIGTDGGVYQSADRGGSWRFLRNLPVSQFYHVSVDQQTPYHVYGGLQDNGSWTAPSRGVVNVRNEDWSNVGYGDGFWVWADPQDPQIVYSEYQGGKLLRVDRRTDEVKSIEISQGKDDAPLRFNWNTPFVVSPSGRLLAGSQYLHASSDRGESWQRLSPDLTSNNPKLQRQAQSGGLTRDNSTAENNTTIYTIAESPLDSKLIWTGSDDGRIHLTRDDGKRWRDVTPKLSDIPTGAWISRVEASAHQPGTALVTIDDHRRGDFQPYVLRTDDFGASWTRLPTSNVKGYAWVIKQDPVRASLLYLGTELGLFVSLDEGQSWTALSANLPPVAVHDLVIHPREQDLVIATHGRGVYIIDDLSALRALDDAVLASPVALLPSRPAVQSLGGTLQDFGGTDEFSGANPPDAAVISFYQAKRHVFGDLKINVYAADGSLMTSLPVDKRRGIVRVQWPMRLKAPRLPPSTQLVQAMVGPRVPEGDYRFELVKGKERLEGQLTVTADPRSPHSPADRAAQQQMALKLYEELAELSYLAANLAELRQQIAQVLPKLDRSGQAVARKFDSDLQALAGTLAAQSTDGGYVSGEMQLRERMGALYGAIAGYDGRPSSSQVQQHQRLSDELKVAQQRYAELSQAQLEALNSRLKADDQPALQPLDRSRWEQQETGGAISKSQRATLPLLLPSLQVY